MKTKRSGLSLSHSISLSLSPSLSRPPSLSPGVWHNFVLCVAALAFLFLLPFLLLPAYSTGGGALVTEVVQVRIHVFKMHFYFPSKCGGGGHLDDGGSPSRASLRAPVPRAPRPTAPAASRWATSSPGWRTAPWRAWRTGAAACLASLAPRRRGTASPAPACSPAGPTVGVRAARRSNGIGSKPTEERQREL